MFVKLIFFVFVDSAKLFVEVFILTDQIFVFYGTLGIRTELLLSSKWSLDL